MASTPHRIEISGLRLRRAVVGVLLLAYQARLGRLRRLSPGVYVVEPTAMTPSMRSRCRSAVRSDSDRDRGERIVLEHRAPPSLDEFDLLGTDSGDA